MGPASAFVGGSLVLQALTKGWPVALWVTLFEPERQKTDVNVNWSARLKDFIGLFAVLLLIGLGISFVEKADSKAAWSMTLFLLFIQAVINVEELAASLEYLDRVS